MARMVVTAPEYTKSKYNLKELKALETLVADAVEINIPFNNPVTSVTALPKLRKFGSRLILWQGLLRIYTQGWHPRQGYPRQPFGKNLAI
jgi:hypothetical protein